MPEIVPESHILEPPNTAVSYKFSLQLVLGHQYLVKNPGDRMCPRGVLLFLAKLTAPGCGSLEYHKAVPLLIHEDFTGAW